MGVQSPCTLPTHFQYVLEVKQFVLALNDPGFRSSQCFKEMLTCPFLFETCAYG